MNVTVLGPADTLRELHASSSTRLFPVEMSRARKSSETICPERFCGPPQHSKGQQTGVGRGAVRGVQIDTGAAK